jgi:hypothetical protein
MLSSVANRDHQILLAVATRCASVTRPATQDSHNVSHAPRSCRRAAADRRRAHPVQPGCYITVARGVREATEVVARTPHTVSTIIKPSFCYIGCDCYFHESFIMCKGRNLKGTEKSYK